MPTSRSHRPEYAEAQLGPTAEERALADAQVHAAEAARDVVEARAAKMLLRAPATGLIGLVVPEIGEAVIPGETVLTLVPDGGAWFGFNLREDALGGLEIGAQVPVAATAGALIAGQVAEIAQLGRVCHVACRPSRAGTTTSTRSSCVSIPTQSSASPPARAKLCGCSCPRIRRGWC